MRITTKGQVTIPQQIRERFGLLPATEVEFVVEGNAVHIRRTRRAAQTRGAEVIRRLKGRTSVRMSTDEIMKLTRKS